MENELVIRLEKPADRREVENLVRESFWNVYRPGALEHFVLHRLRDDPAFVPGLDFVMEKDGRIVGQNVFVRAKIRDDGVRGEYATPEGYFACENEQDAFAAFDAQFPPKEKLKLPGQLGS